MSTTTRTTLRSAAVAIAALLTTLIAAPSVSAQMIEVSAPGKVIAAPTTLTRTSAEDREHMRTTIRSQMQALRAVQTKRAFDLVAPEVQKRFGSAERFFVLMAKFYAPMLQTKRVQFDGVIENGANPIQRAFITDKKNRQYLVLFTMELQADENCWRVRDTTIVRAPGHVV